MVGEVFLTFTLNEYYNADFYILASCSLLKARLESALNEREVLRIGGARAGS